MINEEVWNDFISYLPSLLTPFESVLLIEASHKPQLAETLAVKLPKRTFPFATLKLTKKVEHWDRILTL